MKSAICRTLSSENQITYCVVLVPSAADSLSTSFSLKLHVKLDGKISFNLNVRNLPFTVVRENEL